MLKKLPSDIFFTFASSNSSQFYFNSPFLHALKHRAYLSKSVCGFSIFDPGSFLLTIFSGKVCVLLDSAQEFIQREAGVLLIFFKCLYNQLNPVNFILTY